MKPFRTTWTQFQGDSDNSGYVALYTPGFFFGWTAPSILVPGGGSPIIDPLDDSIYFTDAVGHLMKFDTRSEEVWIRNAATSEQWGSTPAIDNAGRIYALFSNYAESVLVCYDRDGNQLWRWVPPGPTDADHPTILWGSPKVWNQSDGGALIFLVLSYLNLETDTQWNLLMGFNHMGLALAGVWFSTTFVFDAHGGGGFRLKREHVLPVTHRGLHIPNLPDPHPPINPGSTPIKPLPDQKLWEPTCAVIDGASPDSPMIIATDGHATVAAFQWSGPRGLTQLWSKQPSNDGFPTLTAPAVLPNGLLAMGCSDGDLKLLDPHTGDYWKPWPNLGARIIGTPASFLRQIYVSTVNGDVAMIDSNGAIVKTVNVGGQIAGSAMVTATNVYVPAANGVAIFDLFLDHHHTLGYGIGGVSSLAIGSNGTLYLIADNHLLAHVTA